MIGKTIGGYRIIEKIGQGGMGSVYAARHEKLPKSAAVKVLSMGVAQDSTQVARFFTEAKAISLIQHPAIVTLYDYGQMADGTVYMLMELLSGLSLKERQEQDPLPLTESLHIIQRVAYALAAVHQQGIVHRDLKPANIMLIPSDDKGPQVKILDFGVAKFVQSLELQSVPGTVLGTPAYMSPEQSAGSTPISDRTDVYSLGIMAYELLTGQYPYQLKGNSWSELLRAHQEEPMQPLLPLVPGLQHEVADLIREMLDKEPAQRPSMADLAVRLNGGLAETVGTALPPPPVSPATHSMVTETGQPPARRAAVPVQSPSRRSPRSVRNKVFLGVAVLAPLAGLAVWRNLLEPPDYALLKVHRVGPCETENAQFVRDDKNIIASELYAMKKMEPDRYDAEPDDRAIIKHEENEGPTFYRIQTTEKAFRYKGGTHGGFRYELDPTSLPLKKKYRVSFCAWSLTAEGLGLRIHHSHGNGSVSSLIRTAMLTDKHDRFEWVETLEWPSKPNDGPPQYVYGYLVNPVNGSGYDLNAPQRFSKKEFVIGDLRIERVP